MTDKSSNYTYVELSSLAPPTATIPLLLVWSAGLSHLTLKRLHEWVGSESGKQTYSKLIDCFCSSRTVDEIALYQGAIRSFVKMALQHEKPDRHETPDQSNEEHFSDFQAIMRGFSPTYTSETLRRMSWSFCCVTGASRKSSAIFVAILGLENDTGDEGYNNKLGIAYYKWRCEHKANHEETCLRQESRYVPYFSCI